MRSGKLEQNATETKCLDPELERVEFTVDVNANFDFRADVHGVA